MRFRDRQGDVWTPGDDGLLHTPETAPFTREHVERKWGPLTPAEDAPLPGRPRVPREDLDPELVARAKRVIRARERRDRWARHDHDVAEASHEAREIRSGGNRR